MRGRVAEGKGTPCEILHMRDAGLHVATRDLHVHTNGVHAHIIGVHAYTTGVYAQPVSTSVSSLEVNVAFQDLGVKSETGSELVPSFTLHPSLFTLASPARRPARDADTTPLALHQ